MPCVEDRDNTPNFLIKESEVVAHYKNIINDIQKENNRLSDRCKALTTLLCMAGRAYFNKKDMPTSVVGYWKAHKELDESNGRPWIDESNNIL